MPVLRSREIPPLPPKPRKTRVNVDQPATPTQGRERPASRRSTPSPATSLELPGPGYDSLQTRRRSSRLASKVASSSGEQVGVSEEMNQLASPSESVPKKRRLSLEGNGDFESGESEGILSLRPGKRVTRTSSVDDGCDKEVESDKKGKRVLRVEGESSVGDDRDNEFGSEKKMRTVLRVGSEDNDKPERNNENDNVSSRRRITREEKGKGELTVEIVLESEAKSSGDGSVSGLNLTEKKFTPTNNKKENVGRMETFRDVARRNASRFAHFDNQEEDDNTSSVEAETETLSENEQQQDKSIEDWPGPFSTAMKIIRDRAKNLNLKQEISSSDRMEPVKIPWIPQKGKGKDPLKRSPPALLDMCLRILVYNADAIASLEYVPDALRHKLCQMLCDSRRINSKFLDHLLSGSPSEIRVRDCSWLMEEQFTKCFERCNTANLTVLQLDNCGCCLPDYILFSTLARSSNSLPALTSLSLTGAYRLSDSGLNVIVSSAPALRSINLSQCSFLTHKAIDHLANSLGSVLLELYIDDCQSIDANLILPALKKLEHLEVLSVAGLEPVTDGFIKEFVTVCGYGIKELGLAGCGKLTDYSMKIISETCSNLCALDISNVSKLTDFTLGYLANGCRLLQSLKLSRNAFSDDAIAAFLETSGEVLKELSLNNVGQVGPNTALALARRSRNLLSLDLSWCRNLTDEAVGLIVDSCLSLRVVKLFGCTQITDVFLDGHSNSKVEIIGLKFSPLLKHIRVPDSQEGLLR